MSTAEPTKAELLEQVSALADELLDEKAAHVGTRERYERHLAAADPEAKALDACVRALDTYTALTDTRNGYNRFPRDVTRILLFLAARYGAAVQAAPAPDPRLELDTRVAQLALEAESLRRQVQA